MGQPSFVEESYAGTPGAKLRARAPYTRRHRNAFIGLSASILFVCIVHTVLGAVITAVTDPDFEYYPTMNNNNVIHNSTSDHVAMAFFWCTIPAVLSILTLYELVRICKCTLPSKWITWSSGVAFFLWGGQMGIEWSCIWRTWSTGGGYCPWDGPYYDGAAFAAWMAPWCIIPVLCLYITIFSVGMRAVVIDRRERKEEQALLADKADSLSLHTLSTAPFTETLAGSGGETLRTSMRTSTRGPTRPPSYFSSNRYSGMSEYDEKKEQF